MTNFTTMRFLLLLSTLFFSPFAFGQTATPAKVEIEGQILWQTITEEGDTILYTTLGEVGVTEPRTFASRRDRLIYKRWLRYAIIVYPYAKEAIQIFRELESETHGMKKRHRKKRVKQLQRELKEKFEDPMKNLTKLQGKLLIKMIEKELDTPMYDLLKTWRGGATATYWSTLSRFYGYRLKEGYVPGQDPLMDAVLQDFDVSYE